MVSIKIIFVLLFSVCNGLQFPFLNLGFPSFQKTLFPISPVNEPFEQKDDLPTTSNILDDLESIPMMPYMDGNEKNVKTQKQTKVKDGYKITTVNKTGPGFFSFMSEVENNGGKKNGSISDFSSAIMNAGNLFRMLNPSMKKKCGKMCPSDKFCDPLYGKCRPRFAIGSRCMLINQCSSGLRCVWGRCNKANTGDAGTFCKRKDQCSNNACCIKQGDSFHAVCVPALDEGAICGEIISDMFMNTLSPERDIKAKQCSPCKAGLKCGDVGDPIKKRCVPKSYIEKPKDEKEGLETEETDKNEDGGSGENDEDENNNGSDDEVDVSGSIPVKTGPKKKSKNKKTSDKSTKHNH